MEAKDRQEFEVDGYRIKIIRREAGQGPDNIDVNMYDYPDERLRDFSQYNFRVSEDDDARVATYIPRKNKPQPDVTALRALHEYGWECDNVHLAEVWEQWEPREAVEVILRLFGKAESGFEQQNDPAAAHLIDVSGRCFQHTWGWLRSAREQGYDTLTEFLEKLEEENITAKKQINEDIERTDEVIEAELFIAEAIEEEYDIGFEEFKEEDS